MRIPSLHIKTRLFRSIAVSLGLLLSPIVMASPESRLSDEPAVPDYNDYKRTAPLVEIGESFLGTGNIKPGFEIFTGAIWQPQFLVWGDMRTAYQDFDSGTERTREWANRLNLFGQLRLSPTERFLISLRPLDEDGRFTGKQWQPEEENINSLNANVRTFYFEGEFGELFPNLDRNDSKGLDWGFAVGRQPVFIQEGMLINDNIDAFGVVRNSVRIKGTSNTHITAMYGWNEINRGNNVEDDKANLWALFTETDLYCCTVNVDLAYVDSNNGSDGYFAAISSVQRFGHLSSSFRFLHSSAKGKETNAIRTGSLIFAETSWTPTGTEDNIYINAYLGIDQFTSAARDVDTGGPLGRTGILFAAVGLGNYGAALNNDPADSYGGAVGYQKYFDGQRKQLILELGARNETQDEETGAVAIGARYQQAYGKHTIFLVDGFVNSTDIAGSGKGLRTEVRWKF